MKRARREKTRPDPGARLDLAVFASRLRREAKEEFSFQVGLMGGGEELWGEVVWGLEYGVQDL